MRGRRHTAAHCSVVPPDAALLAAIRAAWAPYAGEERRAARGSWTTALFLKWQLMRLTHFSAVLFADLDVDLLPPELWHRHAALRALWSTSLPALLSASLRGGVRIVVTADHVSPIQAGQFLMIPDRELYQVVGISYHIS